MRQHTHRPHHPHQPAGPGGLQVNDYRPVSQMHPERAGVIAHLRAAAERLERTPTPSEPLQPSEQRHIHGTGAELMRGVPGNA